MLKCRHTEELKNEIKQNWTVVCATKQIESKEENCVLLINFKSSKKQQILHKMNVTIDGYFRSYEFSEVSVYCMLATKTEPEAASV